MYTSIHLLKKYLHYYVTALNGKGHGMHSPFVFDFILNVLNNASGYLAPIKIETLRQQMLSDKRPINGIDLGAGSRKPGNKKKVSDIARTALKPKKYAELFYRLVKHYQPSRVLELGTSLGITTAYLHSGNPDAYVITIEGNKGIADIARENFEKLDLRNTQIVIGNFDDVLPQVLQNNPVIDLAFIDGNHQLKPTVEYFHQLLECSQTQTILVFDDIHWSNEMEQAWKIIREHPRVVYTIDIFFLGFVFFREEFKVKQNFTIRF